MESLIWMFMFQWTCNRFLSIAEHKRGYYDLDGLASQRILTRCGFVEKTRGETVRWQLDKILLYRMIYRRKSFHLFRNTGNEKIPQHTVDAIKESCKSFTPLYPAIKTAIRIVPADETTCRRGQEYCILLYSEKKDNYLQNMGYLGEQLDLYLVSQNIGTLWFGIGKTQEPSFNGLDFVIMIAISQIDSEMKFRKDIFKSKRKPEEDIWSGEPIKGVTDIVRFAPSACNTSPGSWNIPAI